MVHIWDGTIRDAKTIIGLQSISLHMNGNPDRLR